METNFAVIESTSGLMSGGYCVYPIENGKTMKGKPVATFHYGPFIKREDALEMAHQFAKGEGVMVG